MNIDPTNNLTPSERKARRDEYKQFVVQAILAGAPTTKAAETRAYNAMVYKYGKNWW